MLIFLSGFACGCLLAGLVAFLLLTLSEDLQDPQTNAEAFLDAFGGPKP